MAEEGGRTKEAKVLARHLGLINKINREALNLEEAEDKLYDNNLEFKIKLQFHSRIFVSILNNVSEYIRNYMHVHF